MKTITIEELRSKASQGPFECAQFMGNHYLTEVGNKVAMMTSNESDALLVNHCLNTHAGLLSALKIALPHVDHITDIDTVNDAIEAASNVEVKS